MSPEQWKRNLWTMCFTQWMMHFKLVDCNYKVYSSFMLAHVYLGQVTLFPAAVVSACFSAFALKTAMLCMSLCEYVLACGLVVLVCVYLLARPTFQLPESLRVSSPVLASPPYWRPVLVSGCTLTLPPSPRRGSMVRAPPAYSTANTLLCV